MVVSLNFSHSNQDIKVCFPCRTMHNYNIYSFQNEFLMDPEDVHNC